MRGRAAAWALGAALLSAPAALADGIVYPVGGGVRLSRQPPLVSVVPPFTESVYHGRLTSRERVLVAVDPRGTVQRVRVQQRLTVSGVGDYAFTVPGPIADVASLPRIGWRAGPPAERDPVGRLLERRPGAGRRGPYPPRGRRRAAAADPPRAARRRAHAGRPQRHGRAGLGPQRLRGPGRAGPRPRRCPRGAARRGLADRRRPRARRRPNRAGHGLGPALGRRPGRRQDDPPGARRPGRCADPAPPPPRRRAGRRSRRRRSGRATRFARRPARPAGAPSAAGSAPPRPSGWPRPSRCRTPGPRSGRRSWPTPTRSAARRRPTATSSSRRRGKSRAVRCRGRAAATGRP